MEMMHKVHRQRPISPVQRRTGEVLTEKPELWSSGRMVRHDLSIELPEAVWVFMINFSKMTNKPLDEVIALFAQECLCSIIRLPDSIL